MRVLLGAGESAWATKNASGRLFSAWAQTPAAIRLDTDLVLGRGRRAGYGARIRWAAAAMVVISAAVPLAITMTHGGKAPDTVVDLPPTPNPSSHLTPQAVEECHTLSPVQSSPVRTDASTRTCPGHHGGRHDSRSRQQQLDVDVQHRPGRRGHRHPASIPSRCGTHPHQPVETSRRGLRRRDVHPRCHRRPRLGGRRGAPTRQTQILYHFPDGHIEPAAITEGPNGARHWAMQYVSPPKPLGREDDHPISVEVFVGTSGKPFWTIDLKWGEDTCAVAQRCERTPSGME